MKNQAFQRHARLLFAGTKEDTARGLAARGRGGPHNYPELISVTFPFIARSRAFDVRDVHGLCRERADHSQPRPKNRRTVPRVCRAPRIPLSLRSFPSSLAEFSTLCVRLTGTCARLESKCVCVYVPYRHIDPPVPPVAPLRAANGSTLTRYQVASEIFFFLLFLYPSEEMNGFKLTGGIS